MIAVFGGLNPYRKPNWRICLAQNVLKKRGGIFHEIEGVKSMLVLGPDGKRYYRKVGDKVFSGYAEVPRYPHKGWIIERWQPAHIWGTKELWESHKGEDGTPMMGPFPVEGDYWMVNQTPFDKLPDWGDLECSIAMYEKEQRMRPTDLASALRQAVYEEQQRDEARLRKMEEELEYIRLDIEQVMKSGSLDAQRVRQMLAGMVGDHAHSAIL